MSANDSTEPIVMSASEVREHFSEVVNRVARGEGRVIVEKHGAPAAGLVPMEDIRRLRNYDDVLNRRREGLDRIRSYFDDIPVDEWEREVEAAFDEMREQRRAAQHGKVSAAS